MLETRRLGRLVLIAMTGALVVGTAAACSSSKTTAASTDVGTGSGAGSATASKSCSVNGDKIALVGPLRGNPTLQLMAQGFKDESSKDGFNGQVLLAEDANPQSSLTLGQQALAQGVKGMVLLAFDASLYPLIAQAHAKHIPVVVTHFPVTATQAPGLTQTIVTDVAQYGKAAADSIGAQINGAGSVAVTEGSFNPTEDLAASSFTAEMKSKYPAVTVLKPQEEGFDAPTAISKLAAILQANPKVNAAFSTTGGGPTDWSGAAAQANRKVTIISMDYTRPNLDLVKSGKVYALIGQPIYQENSDAVDSLRTVLCGGSVPQQVHPVSPVITSADLSSYYALNDRVGK